MGKLGRWSMVIVGSALAIAPALQARTCNGSGDLIGSFGWVGSRSKQFVPQVDPAATPAAPIAGSNTAIGALAAGAVNSTSFTIVGRVLIDGNGGIFASSDPTTSLLQVGKYVVNTDCTVSATITDAFATPGEAFITPVQASATFEGVVVQNGNEIDLVQTGSAAGTTLTLKKTRQFNACTTDIFAGTFGLSASGISTPAAVGTATPVSSPFNLYARLVADGAGNFVQDSFGLLSPLVGRQLTGTYTVNTDCTGSGTLIGSDAKTKKINFVLVSSGPGATGAQALLFAFTDTSVVGGGVAQQQ